MESTSLLWGNPRQFSLLEFFRSLVVPSGGWCKAIILQGNMMPAGVLQNVLFCLRRKGGITVASVHTPIQIKSPYRQATRRFIYNTICPKHPHSPIRRYKQCPQGPVILKFRIYFVNFLLAFDRYLLFELFYVIYILYGFNHISMVINCPLNGLVWRFPEIYHPEIILCEP